MPRRPHAAAPPRAARAQPRGQQPQQHNDDEEASDAEAKVKGLIRISCLPRLGIRTREPSLNDDFMDMDALKERYLPLIKAQLEEEPLNYGRLCLEVCSLYPSQLALILPSTCRIWYSGNGHEEKLAQAMIEMMREMDNNDGDDDDEDDEDDVGNNYLESIKVLAVPSTATSPYNFSQCFDFYCDVGDEGSKVYQVYTQVQGHFNLELDQIKLMILPPFPQQQQQPELANDDSNDNDNVNNNAGNNKIIGTEMIHDLNTSVYDYKLSKFAPTLFFYLPKDYAHTHQFDPSTHRWLTNEEMVDEKKRREPYVIKPTGDNNIAVIINVPENQSNFNLVIKQSDTISHVKKLIQKETGYDVKKQQLISKSRVLENRRKVQSYEIRDGDTIGVVV